MKLLMPAAIAILGLGAGVGAGLALKPAPPEAEPCAEGGECPTTETVEDLAPLTADGRDYVPFDKPFVVPIFAEDRVVAMVVVALSLETTAGQGDAVLAFQPRLRDAFLAVMFRHANSGGFDGSFTSGQKIADLKSALLATGREVMPGIALGDILVTEIVRQNV